MILADYRNKKWAFDTAVMGFTLTSTCNCTSVKRSVCISVQCTTVGAPCSQKCYDKILATTTDPEELKVSIQHGS